MVDGHCIREAGVGGKAHPVLWRQRRALLGRPIKRGLHLLCCARGLQQRLCAVQPIHLILACTTLMPCPNALATPSVLAATVKALCALCHSAGTWSVSCATVSCMARTVRPGHRRPLAYIHKAHTGKTSCALYHPQTSLLHTLPVAADCVPRVCLLATDCVKPISCIH